MTVKTLCQSLLYTSSVMHLQHLLLRLGIFVKVLFCLRLVIIKEWY